MAVLLAVAATIMLVESFGLSRSASLIPRIVLSVTVLLLLIELVLIGLKHNAADHSEKDHSGTVTARPTGVATPPWQTFLWLSLLPALLWLMGLIFGSIVFCLFFLKWRSRESWVFSGVFSLVLGASLYLVFSVLLQSNLYPGVIDFHGL